jgi:hypothetical protein
MAGEFIVSRPFFWAARQAAHAGGSNTVEHHATIVVIQHENCQPARHASGAHQSSDNPAHPASTQAIARNHTLIAATIAD